MKLHNKLIILLTSILFLLCGCYNSKELDDLAYVVAVGIDKGETQKYKITFQIAVPVNIGSEGSTPRSKHIIITNSRSKYNRYCNFIC